MSRGFKLLPPAPDVCQECAVKHPPEQAHNRDSMYYQYKFHAKNGRWPVWSDAIAHCSPELRAFWEDKLRKAGAWEEPGKVEHRRRWRTVDGDETIGTVKTIPIRRRKKKK